MARNEADPCAPDDDLPRPRAAEAAEVLRAVADASERGERVALATVLARRGSAPSTPGQKLALTDRGDCAGTVGGGAVERQVLLALRAVAAGEPAPTAVRSFKLGAELGMCCGGAVDVVIEAIDAPPPVLVVGAGHIGSVVAPLLSRCGFHVTLVDEREGWADEAREEARLRRVAGDFALVGKPIARRGAVLVMTHDHQLDQRVIEWALGAGFSFVGGVGSRAKLARTKARLEAKSFPEADLGRIRMPLGIDIGARSPEEIAVSIVGEMIAWRRGASTTAITSRTAG